MTEKTTLVSHCNTVLRICFSLQTLHINLKRIQLFRVGYNSQETAAILWISKNLNNLYKNVAVLQLCCYSEMVMRRTDDANLQLHSTWGSTWVHQGQECNRMFGQDKQDYNHLLVRLILLRLSPFLLRLSDRPIFPRFETLFSWETWQRVEHSSRHLCTCSKYATTIKSM